jgi:hypothetical protein
MNVHLDELAKKYYPQAKFLRIHSEQLTQVMNFDPIAFPALLVYRNKDLMATLLRISDEIPIWKKETACSTQDLEDYLIENQVLTHLLDLEIQN